MKSSKNIKAIKLVIYGMMFTSVSRIIFIFSYFLTNLTILIILNALTTVTAVDILDPLENKSRTIPKSVPITTIISNTFHAE